MLPAVLRRVSLAGSADSLRDDGAAAGEFAAVLSGASLAGSAGCLRDDGGAAGALAAVLIGPSLADNARAWLEHFAGRCAADGDDFCTRQPI